jgi:hypothetical protein
MLTGDLQPKAIVSFDEKWEAAYAAASPSEEASKALASVPPGGEVLVVLGTWCGDSRREVSRFAKALEIAGTVPFQVRWVGVDRRKNGPGIDAQALGIRYVPTFVVSRGGKETGRVVESSPEGIERDVGALLRGDKTGVVTARPPDPSPSAAPSH